MLRAALPLPPVLLIAVLLSGAPARARTKARPKFQTAMGMGTSLDRAAVIPSFFFLGGFGDGLFGLDLGLFANGATQTQVTRVAGDLLVLMRPAARACAGSGGYGTRVLGTVSLGAGPSFEHLAKGFAKSSRLGGVATAHFDLPLGPAHEPKELRLRLGGRRMFAAKTTVGGTEVADSTVEIYGLLAFVF